MKKIIFFSFVFVTLLAISACGNSNEVSSQKESKNYQKKIEILERVENKDSTLSRMTNLLINEWPVLFKQSSEAELWKSYCRLTWHVEKDEQEQLKKNLTHHPEYLSYVDLLKKGILPARSVTVKEVNTQRNTENLGHLVKVTYDLLLKDGTTKELQVTLNADDNMETFNDRFVPMVAGADNVIPEPKNEQEELYRRFLLKLLDYNVSKKMTHEEFIEILN
ncbi:hypothetical protein C2W64_00763 [Brevibacillus laterosporus]|nr:hypothetical protein [Brevibacillus laterosporus]RAP17463.1 hypothetical protein C2W64_00763 [Brevibacillus laterosporus]